MDTKVDTRERVLEAACHVFAAKGYRDATVQEICSLAGANVAAGNYYFSSKKNLYLAVWEHLYNTAQEQYYSAVSAIQDPELRLREIIAQRVRHAFDDGVAGKFRQIIRSEIGSPTEVHEEVRLRFLKPQLDIIAATVAEITGRAVSDPVVRRCAFSVHSQLVVLSRLRAGNRTGPIEELVGSSSPSEEQIGELVGHLANFTLAGVKASASGGSNSQ